jgi:uncharacterized membrane protein HdeD (DUF308 family)
MTVFHWIMYQGSQHPYEFALVGFIAACGLFWTREHYRMFYAFIEIGFGVLALMNATPSFTGGPGADIEREITRSESHWSIVTIAGAIFFIIRGIDNLDRGLAATALWRQLRETLRLPHRS